MTNKIWYFAVGILVLGFLGFFTLTGFGNDGQGEQSNQVNQTQPSTQQIQGVSEQNAQNADSGFSERFLSYSEDNLKIATENGGKAVIFLHAGWCPMCQAAEADLRKNFSQVPTDVTILKANYDTESGLKPKYAVTMQDTWIQVDSEGNEIAKWNSGGEGVKGLLANVK